ncbi:MAG: glycosyltransferase family 61 protein [Arenicellaceae bacterium]|nr:glycosyltransferase family 61 protein [Arenicellaceae bacterium]
MRALEKASVYNLMEVWCSDKGRIFTQDGQAAFEAWNRCDIKLFHKLRNYCRGVDLTDHRANKDSIPVIDKAVIATQSNDCAYGHFLMEVIPRLGLVGMSQLQNIPVYVSTKYPQYLEALHYLGLRENILSSQKYPVIYCKEAIIPKFQSTGYFQYPQFAIETLSMIKARVLAESKDFRDNPRRIFLSKMGYESVVGEESVVPLLLQRGFEIIVPQELSFADQVRLFHNAETVVSHNNSEICNILFCQPGSKIISLFHASNTQALMSITETLGHDYFVVKTNTGSLIRWQRKCCFEPDITALSAALDAAGVKC